MTFVIDVGECYYPESDGKPMGETDEHRDEMVRHIELLRRHYRGQQVYVSGNLLVYYEQGNPRKFVVPDAFIVKGASPRKRRIFKIWTERRVPDVVIETTSRKTKKKDTRDKPELYCRLGVKEYFMFDPDHEYLDPPLQGYRLEKEGYVRMEPVENAALVSHELDMLLMPAEGLLQFYRKDNGERLLTAEERAACEAAERRREAGEKQLEIEARRAAEAEVRRLRAELAKRDLKGG